MTSTDVAIREQHVPATVRLDTEQLRYIANTEFVPKGLRGNLPAILACVATGREIGIGDMAALRSIHIIDGKPTYSAELMVALVRRAGHSITGSSSTESATVKGRRRDNGDEIEVTWTLEDAKRAGLLNKQNWVKYPQSMLWARAVSQLCRELFPEVAQGNGFYTSEEMGAEDTDELGVPIEGEAMEVREPLPPLMDEDVPFSDAPVEGVQTPVKVKKDDPMWGYSNMVIPKLKEAGTIEMEAIYGAIAATRKWSTEELVKVVEGRKKDGSLSWAKLRDNLTRTELRGLLDTLAPMFKALEESAGEPNGGSEPAGAGVSASEPSVSQAAGASAEPASPADDPELPTVEDVQAIYRRVRESADLSPEATAHRLSEIQEYAASQPAEKHAKIVAAVAQADGDLAAGRLTAAAHAEWVLAQFQRMLQKQGAGA